MDSTQSPARPPDALDHLLTRIRAFQRKYRMGDGRMSHELFKNGHSLAAVRARTQNIGVDKVRDCNARLDALERLARRGEGNWRRVKIIESLSATA